MSAVEARPDLSFRGSSSSEPHNRNGSQRIAELDGLRGLACLMVVVSHAFILPADMGGVVGVTIFFVLSGFLITSLLLLEKRDHGSVRLRSFYGRRALRLVPALLIYLSGIGAVLATSGLAVSIWDVTWPPALYVSNYAHIAGRFIAPHVHTWSLAVEEHFYLLWPLLLLLGAAKRLRYLAWAVVLLFGWRVVAASVDLMWAYQGTDTNAYALGAGCLLAVARQKGVGFRLPALTPALGIAALTAAMFVPVADLTEFLGTAVWLAPLSAAVAVMTISATLDHRPAFLRSSVLCWFGVISYSLYLWHAPFMLIPPFSDSAEGRFVGILLAVGLASASWYWVERPILRSRMKLKLERSKLSDGDQGGRGNRLAVGVNLAGSDASPV